MTLEHREEKVKVSLDHPQDRHDGTPDGNFKPQHLEHRQCIALTAKQKQCSGEIGTGQLACATGEIAKLKAPYGTESGIRTVICLLICKNHNEVVKSAQIEGLVKKYGSELARYASMQTHLALEEARPCQRSSGVTVRMKLQSRIKQSQFSKGFVYVFNSRFQPGFVKIGCCERSPARRIKEWEKCYPGATLQIEAPFNFPQRMEELIHLDMADMRVAKPCNLQSCKSRTHDEWFRCSVEEAQRVIQEWEEISGSQLYSDMRVLTIRWQKILQVSRRNYETRLSARSLLVFLQSDSDAEHGSISREFEQMSS